MRLENAGSGRVAEGAPPETRPEQGLESPEEPSAPPVLRVVLDEDEIPSALKAIEGHLREGKVVVLKPRDTPPDLVA